MFSRKKSILFINPSYHNSFLLRDELRKMGWKADIVKGSQFPELLLYQNDCINDPTQAVETTSWNKIRAYFTKFIFFINTILRYRYFVVYGSPVVYPFIPYVIAKRFKKWRFSEDLALLKLFRCKIIYELSGCKEEALQADVRKEYPQLCGNCGYASGVCDDEKNGYSLDVRNRYGSFTIASTPMPTQRTNMEFIKYKCVDLDLWHPNLAIPDEFKLPPTSNLRIMHSFFDKNRLNNGKNIKGSPFIVEAINRLKEEGYPVEYYFVNSVPSKYMRYYQAQADIIVEQLIYGWWGSSGMETMALGKPVVCYLHPMWKQRFLERYPEYQELPIVEATVRSIYDVLKRLVEDPKYRKERGEASRVFAMQHFDFKRNAEELSKRLLNL